MSELQLNDQPIFKEFKGPIHRTMPVLLEEGRRPALVTDIFSQRMHAVNSGAAEEVVSAWEDHYFDTGGAPLYHPDGTVKVVPNSLDLQSLTPDSLLSRGAFVLGGVNDRDASVAVYDAVDAAEFTRSELENYTGGVLTLQEAKDNPVWEALIPDAALRNAAIDFTFSRGKQRFGYDRMMGVWLAQPQEVAVGRSWVVYGLGYDSDAGGNLDLVGSNSRLVGVRDGVAVASAEGAARDITVQYERSVADSVHAYLQSRTVAEGATKKGLLGAIQQARP